MGLAGLVDKAIPKKSLLMIMDAFWELYIYIYIYISADFQPKQNNAVREELNGSGSSIAPVV